MSKHTPGPWKFLVADSVKSEHGIIYHEVYGSNNSVVARRVISDSDVRLIAAAPELLKAAKNLLSHIQKPIVGSRVDTAWETEKILRSKLADAITKAEGK